LILLGGTLGFAGVSALTGLLVRRIGLGSYLVIGAACRVVGTLLFAMSPAWELVPLANLILGIGGGILDGGFNAFLALRYQPRHLNWMHAFYGVGVTIGPLLMAQVFDFNWSWRVAYLIALIAVLPLLVVVSFFRRSFVLRDESRPDPSIERRRQPFTRLLTMPILWLSVLLFFLYTGTEVSIGQWTFTLFTESQGILAVPAGRWVAVYWASFTVGRFLFGFLDERIEPRLVLRVAILTAWLGTSLIWWNPGSLGSYAGLMLTGFSLAPIFPLLIAVTPRRVGDAHATTAVGLQVSAASIGVFVVPGLVGMLAARIDIAIIGPAFVATTALLFIIHELTIALLKNGSVIEVQEKIG
jgi:fucose permease